mgnify:FL=1
MRHSHRWAALFLAAGLALVLAACSAGNNGTTENNEAPSSAQDTRTITDSAGRTVEIPKTIERIVCVNVGALRYTCYM